MAPGAGPDTKVRILGAEHTARQATVNMDVPPFEGLSWESHAAFLHGDFDVSFAGVLGHVGLLHRWVASFNYYDNYFVIEERDSYVERMPVDVYQLYQEQYDSDWFRPSPM
jgi:hypothetical protein